MPQVCALRIARKALLDIQTHDEVNLAKYCAKVDTIACEALALLDLMGEGTIHINVSRLDELPEPLRPYAK